ncbi:pilin [Candidatus Parcubacteria bacterium]|nr:pilin [Candidatus Parcubacteria bacterium]
MESRGANWRCLPVPGGSQKACVLSPNPEDLQDAFGSGQPCIVGGVQECPGGEACVPVGEESSAGFCATSPAYGSNPLINVLRFTSVEALLVGVLDAVVQIGAILLVLAVVYVGFLFVKAQGKEDEIKKAREAFVWTVIGGLLVLGAQGLALIIQATVQSL